jgi:hypothetical protein
MSQRSQEHQDQAADPQLAPSQDVESPTPVHQPGAAADALQRARGDSSATLRPSDVLALQRTVGNRAVQRLVESAPGSIQRHVSPESEAMYGQSRATVTAAKDQTKSSLQSAESGARGMLSSWNSLMNAFSAARNLPAGGSEDQSSQGSEDIYEG